MLRRLLSLLLLLLAAPLSAADLRIAAAADLRFAMEELLATFRKHHPDERIEVSYGSSGKFYSQIQNGAPFDLFFSADIALPRNLAKEGLAAGEVRPYAVGRLVLWTPKGGIPVRALNDLGKDSFKRIAIANPRHAPYGARAVEALKASGIWPQIESRLVFGENIAQAAQFVQTGNAEAGLIALSLAVNPEFESKGQYLLVPSELHQPLEQGFVILRAAQHKPLAKALADFVTASSGQTILNRHGFVLPGTSAR